MVRSWAKDILLFTLGVIFIPILILFAIITIPAFLYRCFVTKILQKSLFCPKGLNKIVSPMFGTAYAAEFVTSTCRTPPRPSRNVIVQQSFVGGVIPEEECLENIQSKWINAKEKYPELQQYIQPWMGYLFWRDDPSFDLGNHVLFHIVPASENIFDFGKSFAETLLNKPFVPKKSPWEMHIVHSCACFKQTSLPRKYPTDANMDLYQYTPKFCDSCGKEEVTVFITRIHHCLGDGISFMFCLLQGLFGGNLLNQDPNSLLTRTRKPRKPGSTLLTPVKGLVKLCRDIGCVVSFTLWRANDKTPFHIPDAKKTWQQLYERSDLIPLQKMKQIKDHFGVGFSVLVTSCVSKALSKRLTNKIKPEVKNFLVAFVIPLPSHPLDKWINDISGTAYKLPIEDNMDPVERLYVCNQIAQEVNQSLFTQVLFPTLVKLLTYHIAAIVQFGCYNRVLGGGISNFSTPSFMIPVFGKYKLFRTSAAAGGNDGVNGALFGSLGYFDSFHFIVIAEAAGMERKDVKAMVDDMALEVNALYEKMERDKSKLSEKSHLPHVVHGSRQLKNLTPVRQRQFSLSFQEKFQTS